MLRKHNIFRSLSAIRGRGGGAAGAVRSPLRISMQQHYSQPVSTVEQTKWQLRAQQDEMRKPVDIKKDMGYWFCDDTGHLMGEQHRQDGVPHHDDCHSGPYGMEMPVFHAKEMHIEKVEVNLEVKAEGENQEGKDGDANDAIEGNDKRD